MESLKTISMKKVILSAAFAFAAISLQAQTSKSGTVDPHAGHNHGPKAAVAETAKGEESLQILDVHDFGKIPQGKPVTYDFVVTNNGTSPLRINNVQASCGCTTPVWDKDSAIEPGATAKITVGYNAQAEGPFTKPVTITYNDNVTKVINIKGEVFKTPAASAPENKAAAAIKN